MKVAGKRTICEGRFVRIVEKDVVTSDGGTRPWETVERRNIHGNGAVVIVAMTRDGNLLFEKNWRAPIESYVIQFPAGLTDLEGETEEEAARRELLEETGYAATRLIPLLLSPLSAALTPTRAMHYFAPDVEYAGKGTGTDVEEIEVVKVPAGDADDFMLNLPPGVELDLRVPGILWYLRQKQLI